MASTSTWSAQSEALSCPVCQDIFKDPVLLPCSHSFCNDCVKTWWKTKKSRECPLCKAVSIRKLPPRNLVLKTLCESYLLEMDSEVFCRLHNERLRLFCQDDQTPVCLVCRDSRLHTNHRFSPVNEAAERLRKDLGDYLSPLQEKVKLFNEVKLNWDKIDEEIKTQARETETKIKQEFSEIREFLELEEAIRLAGLKDEEEQKRGMMKDKIAGLTAQIKAMESTINTIEEGLRDDDTALLFKVKALKSVTERPLPDDPEQLTDARVDVAKHLGNMRVSVWWKMKNVVSYTPVILNPNTAHPELHMSNDLTNVRCGPKQTFAATPERMKQHRSVLGAKGFTSGCHSWDVQVRDNHVWALGVIAQDAQRTGNILSGLWMLRCCNDKFTAFSPSCSGSVLPLRHRLWRVRVHLDCDKGRLSFIDLDTNKAIHTFTHAFTSRLFPYFNTWSDHPLKIMPRNLFNSNAIV